MKTYTKLPKSNRWQNNKCTYKNDISHGMKSCGFCAGLVFKNKDYLDLVLMEKVI